MSGCDGSCCAAFVISASLDEVALSRIPDRFDLVAMLESISQDEARERWDRFADGYRPPSTADPDAQYYRCVHWDETTRLCGNYERRPAMSRHFPYGRERGCEYGCDCANDRPIALLTAGA